VGEVKGYNVIELVNKYAQCGEILIRDSTISSQSRVYPTVAVIANLGFETTPTASTIERSSPV
jgi:hypothetical protein